MSYTGVIEALRGSRWIDVVAELPTLVECRFFERTRPGSFRLDGLLKRGRIAEAAFGRRSGRVADLGH
jgi:hypothetical protein